MSGCLLLGLTGIYTPTSYHLIFIYMSTFIASLSLVLLSKGFAPQYILHRTIATEETHVLIFLWCWSMYILYLLFITLSQWIQSWWQE
jgi:hypothetical protein